MTATAPEPRSLKETAIWASAACLSAIAITVGLTVTVTRANNQYYDAMRVCVAAGKLWMPIPAGSYSAACVTDGYSYRTGR